MSRGRGVDLKGRSKKDGSHVRIYRFEQDTLAYQSLCVGARALLVEVRSLFTGNNNGELFLSVRKAAQRLNTKSTNAVMDWLWELEDRGWIKPKVPVGYNQKSAARARMATCWIVTNESTNGAVPTREFMTWTGPPRERPKKIRRSPIDDSLSSSGDTLSSTRDRPAKAVSAGRQNCLHTLVRAPDLSSTRDTDSYQGEAIEKPRGAEGLDS